MVSKTQILCVVKYFDSLELVSVALLLKLMCLLLFLYCSRPKVH